MVFFPWRPAAEPASWLVAVPVASVEESLVPTVSSNPCPEGFEVAEQLPKLGGISIRIVLAGAFFRRPLVRAGARRGSRVS